MITQNICVIMRLMQITSKDESLLIQQIRSAGFRMTNLKKDIFLVLMKEGHALSIQSIIKQLSEYDQVSVYRSIDVLRKAGVIKLVPHGFKNLYELSDLFNPHHHHISCDKCGKVTEINDDQLENNLRFLANTNHYTLTSHHLELHGICKNCQG